METVFDEISLGRSYRTFEDAMAKQVLPSVEKVSLRDNTTLDDYDVESIAESVIGFSSDGEYFIFVNSKDFVNIAKQYKKNRYK